MPLALDWGWVAVIDCSMYVCVHPEETCRMWSAASPLRSLPLWRSSTQTGKTGWFYLMVGRASKAVKLVIVSKACVAE